MQPYRTPVLFLSLLAVAACGSSITEERDPPPDPPAADHLVIGGDISFLPQIEEAGGVYSDAEGPKDLIDLMVDHGFDAVRLKLWHTPAEPYNTLERVKAMALRIEAGGLDFLLDFHYSDWWADPGQQNKPAAWESLSFVELVDSVYRYTHDVVEELATQGTAPEMVQLGNEIGPGMLWPDGRVNGAWNTSDQWDNLVALLEAARSGVFDGATAGGGPAPQIMIHFANGANNAGGRAFFDELVARGLDFDAIGLSFYPKWHGTLAQVSANLPDLAARYDKDVYVVETAYPWTLEWKDSAGNIFGEGDLHTGYPATVDGQSAFFRSLRAIVAAVPGERGKGIYYWSPEWIAVPGVDSAWENATLFDFNGRALPSMDVFTGRTP